MANWERKSAYLLREIVKFRTYIDCLQAAQAQKEKIYTERAESPAAQNTQQNAANIDQQEHSGDDKVTEGEKEKEYIPFGGLGL